MNFKICEERLGGKHQSPAVRAAEGKRGNCFTITDGRSDQILLIFGPYISNSIAWGLALRKERASVKGLRTSPHHTWIC